MTFRVVEIYPSFQGEGPNTGKPTLFVRFAGCNLRCPGWPCDTQYAIDPKKYRPLVSELTPHELLNIIIDRLPKKGNICLTGGEVFLQPIRDLQCLLSAIRSSTRARVEVFTNGTVHFSEEIANLIEHVILDWKLPGSGEVLGIQQRIIDDLLSRMGHRDVIKFTIASREDFDVAVARHAAVMKERKEVFAPVVYCGPVWGRIDASELAEWILEANLGWRLNVQTHKFIWPDAEMGV